MTALRNTSEPTPRNRPPRWRWLCLLLMVASAQAQICQSAADMNASTRAALEAAGKRYFEMSAHGDTAALKQNSIASVAANFAGIEAAVQENKTAFARAQAIIRPPFLLTVDGPQPLP